VDVRGGKPYTFHSTNDPCTGMSLSLIEREALVCAQNYHPLPVVLVRGSGAHLWDAGGKRYVDMMSAYSAVSHGHCHPRLVHALTQQAQKLAIASRAFHSEHLGAFLEKLCSMTHMDLALPMNTGAEAVETALKAARKWAYTVKGVAPDRAEVIACEGNFHGRTLGAIALSSEEQYRQGFGPFMPGVRIIPFGDATALERAINANTAAFIVEPIQGEAGIRVPPTGYLRACADICRRHGVLLLADEIQSGLGRTGRLLAFDHEAVRPDGLILGKALGGGLLPVSMFLARREVMSVFKPGDHGSTFGGNALASAVGLEALRVLEEEQLCERSERLGKRLLDQLQTLRSPLVREIRGRGLWVGVDFEPKRIRARAVAEALLARGILTKETHETVVRLAPPLVIDESDLDWACAQFIEAVQTLESSSA
jgi:ornithine--oxo-acid transaminase